MPDQPLKAAQDREFDLVVFGATGFTGRLVCEHLAERRPALRWALAGRNKQKLESVRADLAAIDPKLADLPILLADGLDAPSVDSVARRTRVVCSTVGPFAKYGSALVAACAEHGTDYCDSTGEVQWIREMIDAHHSRAEQTGARIVHCCGFASIPSDLGVFYVDSLLQNQGAHVREVHYRVRRASGGVSGGTVASMLGLLDTIADRNVRRVIGDPYALNPKGERGPDKNDLRRPARDADTGHFTAPFVMAGINTRIVRRSNALLGYPYGKDFRYDEAIDTGAGAKGLLRSLGMSGAMAAAFAAGLTRPGRFVLNKLAPAPGEGPSREKREKGSFKIALHAVSTSGARLTAFVEADRDPGYGATAKMVGESALCLAQDTLSPRGGILTTASCMGHKLIDRLQSVGVRFHVEA